MCSKADDPAYLSMQEADITEKRLARTLHDLGFDLRTRHADPAPFASKAIPRLNDARAILAALSPADRLALAGITEERLAAALAKVPLRVRQTNPDGDGPNVFEADYPTRASLLLAALRETP